MTAKLVTLPRVGRYAVVGFGGLALVWLAGLLVFASNVKAISIPAIDDRLEPADAIVVLTGGSERVNAGLELLKAGKGKKLFISGVHPGLKLKTLLETQNVSEGIQEGRITLGHEAATTMGNADETLGWMKQQNYHSMLLVTGNYHMPRSLMIFRASMPNVKITPHPVAPDKVLLDQWWQHAGTANLLVTEYVKYLWAYTRLTVGA